MTDLEAWERVEKIEKVLGYTFSKELNAHLALIVKGETPSSAGLDRFAKLAFWNRHKEGQ